MDNEITREIIESHLKCKYKSHLNLLGLKGIKSDYEKLFSELRPHFKQKATQKILARTSEAEVVRDVTLTRQLLQQGARYILNGAAKDGVLSLSFDGLKKVEDPSNFANFHYVPILISAAEKIHGEEKRLLALYGLVLAGIQGRHPREGHLIHGQQLRTMKIRLDPYDRKISRTLKEIKDIQKEGASPPLILNNHCQICEFQQRCRQQATNEDNLSLLRGMTEKQMIKYNRKGIFTVTQLSYTYQARKKPPPSIKARHNFALQALAIREKCVFITKAPPLTHEPVRVFLDLEGDPERSFVYLVGALICTPNSETYYSFWADDPSQETTILDCLLDLLCNVGKFHVFHYGAYETKFLRRMREKTTSYEIIDKLLINSTNVLSLIYGQIYFPAYSNSLKHIAQLLGYSWADDLASGINSIVWRHEWEKKPNPDTKKRLLTYNNDDCTALKVVTDFIYAVGTEDKSGVDDSMCARDFQVSYIHDIRPTFSHPDWRTPQFATEDLDYVNRCSYFDYQREKIYVRTNRNIEKQRVRNTRQPKRVKATKRVEIECSTCPYCGSSEITKCREGIRRRKCLDLKITEKCVRRVVNELSSYRYRCGKCDRKFFAEQYMKMVKYGHSLKSWAMYEYVEHRVSFKSLEGTFRDLFGLPVYFRHIWLIKRILANYYRETIEGIRRRLEAGSILHADETQVHLQRVGKGYVWVFTNLEDVLYVYTRSRDGSFHSDMFAGFSGVLISDFYAVYDWPHCAQQKCLIHLIRDLNSELLSNPFDEEYKGLVADFGSLLRRIIATVDRYGLKRLHLAKHQREVNNFLAHLEGRDYRSGAAQSAQERIIRNKDRLFTFLNYDGVPWNNNNAEHAIKRFAHYREVANGHVSENSIIDYLVLLSISQTCKYRGISFLKFLLSGETEIKAYSERHRQKAQTANFEASLLELSFFDKKRRVKTTEVHDEPTEEM